MLLTLKIYLLYNKLIMTMSWDRVVVAKQKNWNFFYFHHQFNLVQGWFQSPPNKKYELVLWRVFFKLKKHLIKILYYIPIFIIKKIKTFFLDTQSIFSTLRL
jgi:hypothetical protein